MADRTGTDRISGVLEHAVETGVTAGAVALVRHRGGTVFHEAVGNATTEPDPLPMRPDTVFDLASLTKPLVGATVALALVDHGAFSLDEEITGFLPELASVTGKGVTFRRLLTHTSGVAGWRPLYVESRDQAGVLSTIDRLGTLSEPGSRFEYSDIGFITLGLALERAGGHTLDALARSLVFDPLGLSRVGFRPDPRTGHFAVTERGNAFERRMAEWAGLRFEGWRNEYHPGEVNDGNCHYALSGVSAHAGLFSDAHDLGVLGEMWRGLGLWEGNRVLSQAVVEQATIEQTSTRARRGLGWQLMNHGPPSLDEVTRPNAGFFPPTRTPWTPRPSGELMSSGSYGHTGFTGTSMWIDPLRELVAVLLTNATHPVVDLDKPVNALRARFHNSVVGSLDRSGPEVIAP